MLGLGEVGSGGAGEGAELIPGGCPYRSPVVLVRGLNVWPLAVLAALNMSLAWLDRLCSRLCSNEALSPVLACCLFSVLE